MILEDVLPLLKQQIDTAKAEQRLLNHILLCGARELTQEVFAYVSAEMGVPTRVITLPNAYRQGDIAAILTHLQVGSILFVDQLHCLEKSLAPVLASAMQDFFLDLVIGKEEQAKHVRLNLPRFAVLAATTRPTLLSYPFHTLFHTEYQIDP